MFLIPKGLLKTNNTLCSLRNLLLLTCINLFRLKSNASAFFCKQDQCNFTYLH